MQTVVDFVGNEIKVGSEIVYGSLLGRSASLSRGEVLEFLPGTYANAGTRMKIQRKKPDGSLEMKTKFIYDRDGTKGGHRHVETGPSTAILNFPNRVVVIDN